MSQRLSGSAGFSHVPHDLMPTITVVGRKIKKTALQEKMGDDFVYVAAFQHFLLREADSHSAIELSYTCSEIEQMLPGFTLRRQRREIVPPVVET